ncbi:hypothetical protein [Nitrosovibrio sp. Nv6]|uniref:hypothetical protein n=1 Tax=Nitrosovibrio sp. Nv6 TaxID=1855340 RepID=UPI0008D59B09|nr:hypothetical protein [Nitrosovibrio sp. Nv6]SEP43819.1 hypothetical protein SAMN05216316_3142 [Nitrosovibrio sp. Nv6]
MYEDELTQVCELFESTSKVLDEIEKRHEAESVYTSKKQFIFAGLHLAKAIRASFYLRKHAYFCTQLKDIKTHCEISSNSAYEYGIKECVRRIELAIADFEETLLIDLVPDYVAIKTRSVLAREFTELDDIHRNQYKSLYESVYNDLQTIEAFYDEVGKKQKEEQQKRILSVTTIGVAFVAAFGAFFGGIGNFGNFYINNNTQQAQLSSPSTPTSPPPSTPTSPPPSTPTSPPPSTPST